MLKEGKHPSCGVLTCCAVKNRHEVCSDCAGYPCRRFDSEKDGIKQFLKNQKIRIPIALDIYPGGWMGEAGYGLLKFIVLQKNAEI